MQSRRCDRSRGRWSLGIALAVVAASFVASPLEACTTAVISGRATVDGRPLLWKNRDYKVTHNEVAFFNDGKYRVVAVVNHGSRSAIWMGFNSAGFCIENSVVKDLEVKDAKGPGNGSFMLLALKTCGSVEEFEQLLQKTNETGRSTGANFGVMDAHGAAALYETSAKTYSKFDAHDENEFPEGYVVRSNFSVTGQSLPRRPTLSDIEKTYSGQRFLRGEALLGARRSTGLDVRYLLRNVTRDMCAGDGVVIPGTINASEGRLPEFIDTTHTISRTTTVSAAVFQGVKPGEDPRLTTMWVMLGDPKFSVAVPVWLAGDHAAPELGRGDNGSELCLTSLELREQYFDKDKQGISTEGLPEVWSQLMTTEDEIVETTLERLDGWRKKGFVPERAEAWHFEAARRAMKSLNQVTRDRVPAAVSP